MEVKVGEDILNVKVVEINGDRAKISVDGRIYDVDVAMVERGVYSIINDNKSYNVELIKGSESRKYTVNTQFRSFDLEIIDAQTKYRESRNKNDNIDGAGIISSPMPGRVVKVLVKSGQTVKAGQAVILVSAMKMESEYKSGIDGVVKSVLVKEGQTIEGNQSLVIIE